MYNPGNQYLPPHGQGQQYHMVQQPAAMQYTPLHLTQAVTSHSDMPTTLGTATGVPLQPHIRTPYMMQVPDNNVPPLMPGTYANPPVSPLQGSLPPMGTQGHIQGASHTYPPGQVGGLQSSSIGSPPVHFQEFQPLQRNKIVYYNSMYPTQANPTQLQPQPKTRERHALSIVDPESGKDVISNNKRARNNSCPDLDSKQRVTPPINFSVPPPSLNLSALHPSTAGAMQGLHPSTAGAMQAFHPSTAGAIPALHPPPIGAIPILHPPTSGAIPILHPPTSGAKQTPSTSGAIPALQSSTSGANSTVDLITNGANALPPLGSYLNMI
ncbi:unnamed protein product, partial [Owenia fusiformis]